MAKTHHELCGACSSISTEHTPRGFLLPGDIAEEICRDNPDWVTTHRRIALAIAERDRLWKERTTSTKSSSSKKKKKNESG